MMTLFQRKWLKVAGALLVLVGAFVAYLFWPRPDELARWKAQMFARGEKFTLAEVAPKFSQEKRDWAKQLQTASLNLVTSPFPGNIEMMASATPGYAVPAWKRPFADETSRTNHTWEALAEQMSKSGDALLALHEILRNIPAGSATDYSDPVKLPGGFNFVTIRKVAQSLSLATVNDLHRGSLQSALTNIHALIGLTRAMDEGGVLVEQMIRTAVAGLGMAATWEALQAPGWDEAQLAALDAGWAEVGLIKRMASGFEIERAWASELLQYARTNSGGPNQFIGRSSGGVEQFLEDQVVTPIWQKAWSKQDELFYHLAMQPIGEGIRDAVTNRSWQRLRPRLESAGWQSLKNRTAFDQLRFQFSAAAIPSFDKALKSMLRQESQLQMTRAAIALERHRLKHGRIPESLAKLVPEFLRETPVDYMTGQPLLFAVNPDGSFVLYSAGEDGRDDDGLGDDAVWPQPGLPARAAAPRLGERIEAFSSDDAPARDVLKQLADQAGLTLLYQPKAAEKLPANLSLSLTNVTVAEAFEAALKRFNLAIVRGPKHSNHCVVLDPFSRKQR